jgi:hypothetical protein
METSDKHWENYMSQSELKQAIDTGTTESGWKGFYKLGGITALIVVVGPLAEVLICFLPGVARLTQRTVTVLLFEHKLPALPPPATASCF